MYNGILEADAAGTWTTGTQGKAITWTKGSNLITMADTTGLLPGMYLNVGLAAGIPRETYILSVDSGTQITVNTYMWKSGAQTRTFFNYPYLLDFRGFTSCSHKRILSVDLLCNGVASGIRGPRDGISWEVCQMNARRVADRFLTDWGGMGSGSHFSFISAQSEDDSDTRTCIGFTINSGDTKFTQNRIINFLYSQVMHNGGYTISGCHNWQGASGSTAPRTPAFLFTSFSGYVTFTGNYFDNSTLEWTSENQQGDPASALNLVTIVGNIFTHNDGAPTDSPFIVIRPFSDSGAVTGINGFIVKGNVFRKLGTALDKADDLLPGNGTLDFANIKGLIWEDNVYRNITKKTTSRPTSTVVLGSGAASDSWNFGDYATSFPFDCHILQVKSIVPGGIDGIYTGANVRTYPGFHGSVNGSNQLIVRFSASVYGQTTATVDCSLEV